MVAGRSLAVVLRVFDHGESDKIVTCYCPDLGKLTGIAKGAKRSKKRFVNKLEIFSLLDIHFATGCRSSLVRIDQAEMFHPFPFLRQNYESYAAAALICELVLNWTRENDGDNELFSLLVWSFDQLNQQQPVAKTLILFQIKMLDLLGYRPHFAGCLQCGTMDEAATPYRFSSSRGGLVCAPCSRRDALTDPAPAPLSLSTIKLLRKAQELPRWKLVRLQFSPFVIDQSFIVLRRYSTYLLQREIQSWSALKVA